MFCKKIIGVESNEQHAKEAIRLKIVDEVLPLQEAIPKSDLIILATPVTTIKKILPTILNLVTTQAVMDVGSTKADIVAKIAPHKNAHLFVPTHPMWGTEHSGPSAAQKIAFKNKVVVICNKESIDPKALTIVSKLYTALGMHIVYMTAEEHDKHTAYISHISHITSFALANTVLQKEKTAATIFDLASGGFESTVRLAKSNAAMWVPIFMQNKKNILDVLIELEIQIAEFKKAMVNESEKDLKKLILQANKIKKILK